MNLLFILPFCQHDANQAVDLLNWIKDLDGKLPFDCALLYDKTPGKVKPRPVIEAATAVFQTVFDPFNVKVQNDSWPSASNQYFCAAARELYSRQEKYQAFWFFEADLLPLSPGWWKTIYDDYLKQGKPHYGAFSPRFDAQRNYQGDHLQGHSIYRTDVWNLGYLQGDNPNPVHNRLIQSLEGYNASEIRNGTRATAFDIYLWRDLIGDKLPDDTFQLAHRSEFIQHAWRSRNYREEKGEIRFDVESYFGQPTHILRETQIIHGCKDDSLLQLMRRKLEIPDKRQTFIPPPPISVMLPKDVRMEVISKPETKEEGEPPLLTPASQTETSQPLTETVSVSEAATESVPPASEAAEKITKYYTTGEKNGVLGRFYHSLSHLKAELAGEEPPGFADDAEVFVPDRTDSEIAAAMTHCALADMVETPQLQPPKKRRARNSYLEDKPPEIAGALRLLGPKFAKCTHAEILECFKIKLETGKKPPVPKPEVPKFTRESLEALVNGERGFLKARAFAFRLGIDAKKMKSQEVVEAILEKQAL